MKGLWRRPGFPFVGSILGRALTPPEEQVRLGKQAAEALQCGKRERRAVRRQQGVRSAFSATAPLPAWARPTACSNCFSSADSAGQRGQ
jgi:hypothetical protein